ncbi:MAG: CUAEP/CCAEP-tail radical SAM (seleno)protein [bacterium]
MPLHVLLISTYELGRQPFGLASPAAWLARDGARVAMNDVAVEHLDEGAVRAAQLIAIYVPMHTAARIAARVLPRVRALNPAAHIACYGLYAPMNAGYLRSLGAQTILGGEFEAPLAALARDIAAERPPAPLPEISVDRQQFLAPARAGLPPLAHYARLSLPDGSEKAVGYTEASRGCKHLCRHCPVVPVYAGHFRVVDRDAVLADIRAQVAAGAQHITFGDPDFLNAPGHAMPLVRALHEQFPQLTYDVTIKIEHLLAHARELPVLHETGCLIVTTAVESIDDDILALLDKGHTAADFARAVALCRAAGVHLAPTFVTFMPWTTLPGFRALLDRIDALDLVDSVAPIQFAIRLLVPAGSRLLELPEVRALLGDFDDDAMSWRWTHSDPRVDALHAAVMARIRRGEASGESRRVTFDAIRVIAQRALAGDAEESLSASAPLGTERVGTDAAIPAGLAPLRAPVPYLTEPWFC